LLLMDLPAFCRFAAGGCLFAKQRRCCTGRKVCEDLVEKQGRTEMKNQWIAGAPSQSDAPDVSGKGLRSRAAPIRSFVFQLMALRKELETAAWTRRNASLRETGPKLAMSLANKELRKDDFALEVVSH
jgi:hypothetical protein